MQKSIEDMGPYYSTLLSSCNSKWLLRLDKHIFPSPWGSHRQSPCAILYLPSLDFAFPRAWQEAHPQKLEKQNSSFFGSRSYFWNTGSKGGKVGVSRRLWRLKGMWKCCRGWQVWINKIESYIKQNSDNLPLYIVSMGHGEIVRIPSPIIPDATMGGSDQALGSS